MLHKVKYWSGGGVPPISWWVLVDIALDFGRQRLPGEVVDAPSLAGFEARLDGALNKLL